MRDRDVGSTAYALSLTSPACPARGRELWGFPRKLARPVLKTDTGTLHEAALRIAAATMGCRYERADLAAAGTSLTDPCLDPALGLGKVVQDYLA